MLNIQFAYEQIIYRLHQLRQKQKKSAISKGLLWFFVTLAAILFLSLAIEGIFRLDSTGRTVLVSALTTCLAAALAVFVFRPLYSLVRQKKKPDDLALSMQVGKYFHVKDKLADAIEVYQDSSRASHGCSTELANASLSDIYDETRNHDFTALVSGAPLRQAIRSALITACAFAIGFLLLRGPFTGAAVRLANPSVDFENESHIALTVTSGNMEVIRGESAKLIASAIGDVEHVRFLVKEPEADEFRSVTAVHDSLGSGFAYRVDEVSTDLVYCAEADGFRSPEYEIKVIDRPFVRRVQIKLVYPRYSGLGSQFLDENIGDVSALRGTSIEFDITANKSLRTAEVVLDNDKRISLEASGRQASGVFVLDRNGSYRFDLQDERDLASEEPIEYRLSVIEDQSPMVQITFPGQDVDLGKDMLLPLSIEAQDDFGFSSARVGYQVLQGGLLETEERFFDLTLPKNSGDKLLLNETWDLSELQLQPQDLVTYYAEVFDNDRVSGFKNTKSLSYTVRYPSLQEMYAEVEKGHQDAFEELSEVYDETRELKKAVDEIVQQMKRDPDLNWEEKQTIQDAAGAQNEMKEKLEDLQEKLDQMVDKMEQNDLLSQETLEKYRELQELMQEMLTPELKQALEELQRSAQEMDPKKLREQMEQLSQSQESLLKSMERTINLLKKLQIEQKLDESIRKTQELTRRQDELNKEAAESVSNEKSGKYADEQQRIRKDLEALEKDLDELRKQMSEFPQMPQEQVSEAQKQAGEEGLQSQMQQSAQQFQQGDMQNALQSGQQISQGLQQMEQILTEAQEQLTEDQKREIMQALKRSSQDLLELSKQQESVMQKTQSSDRNSPNLEDISDRQQDLLSGLTRVTNQMYELSQNTFFVTPEIGKALGKSLGSMQESIKNFEERNLGNSARNQASSMSGLNEAAAEMRNSMQSLQGAQSGIGFQEMMQRLTGISMQQQGVNQQTGELGEQPGDQMARQAAMSRLAGEQNSVRKALEQLLQEAEQSRSETLGDLNQVQDEMEEVVSELVGNRLNRDVMNKQERILSRLLDAQRSVHNRDYSKKRQAETAKEQYSSLSPANLPNMRDNTKDRLRTELMRALNEGYAKDYQILIQKYFEALTREEMLEKEN